MLQKILTLDDQLSHQWRIAEKPGPLRRLAIFFAHSGDSWFWGIGLIITWFLVPSWQFQAVVFFFAIGGLAAIVQPIKWLVRRQRPAGEWGALYRAADPHSFPSGHAARAVMLAVLGLALGSLWLGVVLVIWAPLVALARVAMGVHYLSDIVAGGVLGLVVGLVIRLLLSIWI